LSTSGQESLLGREQVRAVRSIGARWCSEPHATRLRGPKVAGCGADRSLDLTHCTAAHDSRESVPARPCAGNAQHADMGAQSRARIGLRRPSEGTRLNPNSDQLPTVSANALRPARNRPGGGAFILVVSRVSRLPTPDRRHDEPDVRTLSVSKKQERDRTAWKPSTAFVERSCSETPTPVSGQLRGPRLAVVHGQG
jgi:hypothetical protein